MSVQNSQVRIAAGASVSNHADLGRAHLAGILVPAGWTPADITFQGSVDGIGFSDVYDAAGTELKAAAGAGRLVALGEDATRGMRYVRIRSGTSAAAVNQAAERVLTLVLGEAGA